MLHNVIHHQTGYSALTLLATAMCVPIWHWTPVNPGRHEHVQDAMPSTQVPLLIHGLLWHSSISETKSLELFMHLLNEYFIEW